MVTKIKLKNGEAKWVGFIAKKNGALLDLSSAVPSFVMSDTDKTVAYIEKDSTDFDMTDAADGVIKVNLTKTDLSADNVAPGDYVSELKIIFTSQIDEDISQDIPTTIYKSKFS